MVETPFGQKPVSWIPEEHGNLLILGSTGTGKTHLIKQILKSLTEQGGSQIYITQFSPKEYEEFRGQENVRIADDFDSSIGMLRGLRDMAVGRSVTNGENLDRAFIVMDEVSRVLSVSPFLTEEETVLREEILSIVSEILSISEQSKISLIFSSQSFSPGAIGGAEVTKWIGSRILLSPIPEEVAESPADIERFSGLYIVGDGEPELFQGI